MRNFVLYAVFALALVGLSSCGSAVRFSAHPPTAGGSAGTTPTGSSPSSDAQNGESNTPTQNGATFRGFASYYADKFHGRATASGELFDMKAFTAAHRSLPFGTQVQVRNMNNGRTVVVRINDRGPQKTERIIDLSKAAAEAIDMVRAGVVEVEITVVQ